MAFEFFPTYSQKEEEVDRTEENLTMAGVGSIAGAIFGAAGGFMFGGPGGAAAGTVEGAKMGAAAGAWAGASGGLKQELTDQFLPPTQMVGHERTLGRQLYQPSRRVPTETPMLQMPVDYMANLSQAYQQQTPRYDPEYMSGMQRYG